jgi:succinoglycan biosynthesis transport protein ExoP
MHQRTVPYGSLFRREPDPSDSFIDLNRLMTIVLRRARLIALAVAVSVALGVAYLVFATPIYTAMTQILLDEDLSRYAEEADTTPQSSQQVDMRIASAIEILKSGRLALRVVDSLDLSGNETILNPPQSPAAIAKGFVKSLTAFGSSEPAPSAEAEAQGRRQKAAAMLQQALGVERVARSSVVAVSFRSPDPQLSAAIAKGYAEAFFAEQLNANVDASEKASAWLQERLADIQDRSQAAALEVERYRSENGLTAARGELMSEQQLADLNSQLIVAQADAASASARYNQFRAIVEQGPERAVANATIPARQGDSTIVQELRGRYNGVVKREAEITRDFGTDHPQAAALRTEKDDLAGQIYQELQQLTASYRNEHDVARSREASLRENIAKITGSNAEANRSSVHLRALEQKAAALKSLSEAYLGRYEQAAQQQSFPIAKARVISDAGVPTAASSPSKTIVIGLSLVLGLMGGGALTFLQEMRERSFRVGNDIRAVLGLRPLGYLPLVGAQKGRVPREESAEEGDVIPFERMTRIVLDAPGSAFAETLRHARLACDMMLPGRECRVIGMVSALPQEGKSTVAINFAALLAASGKRTLLIDADLRRPSLTAMLKPAPQAGLVEVLLGQAAWKQAIKVDRRSKLAVLPAGARAGGGGIHHPNELMASPGMKTLFDELRQTFDYIIVDLAPLAPVVDVKTFEPLADGFLFVVEWGKTPSPLVRDLLAAETRIEAKVVGVVLNKTDMTALPRYSDFGAAEKYRSLYDQYCTEAVPEKTGARVRLVHSESDGL